MPVTVLAITEEYLGVIFNILTAVGVWIPSPYIGTYKAKLYKILSVLFVGICLVLFIIVEFINLIKMDGDVESIVNSTLLMLTNLAHLYKSLNVIIRRERIGKLKDTFDDPLFNVVDIDTLPIVRATTLFFKKLCSVLLSFGFATVLLWAVFPFIEDEEVKLPLMEWPLFDTSCSPNFELVFTYEILATMRNAFSDISVDLLIAGIMGLACIQLDILQEKLNDKKRVFVEFNNYISGVNHADSLAKNKEIRKHLENCIEHHLAIIRFVDETERVFGFSTLLHFGGSTLVICVTAFKMTKLEISVQLLSMICYMMCMLMEVSVYCYYGNELIIKSQNIIVAAYESLWYKHTLENRKLVFTLMERSKRPVKVSASIFVLSLGTFMSILKSSYSYFALLRQIDN